MDEIEHNHQIVPEMLYEIKNSRFVVAELSHHNNGAYYEAGYALGLGKEVIHICDRKELSRGLHFDVAQVNTSISAEKGKKIIRSEPKPVSTQKQGEYVFYKRDPGIAINALKNADYKCEYCFEHQTFIRKANGMPYTEPHHLVPMRAQKDFSVSLDVENNIVSLCSNCHNLIHYGKGAENLLKKLYNEREQLLQRAGIVITFEELMNYYK